MIAFLIKEILKSYKDDFKKNGNYLLVCFTVTNILFLMVQQYIKWFIQSLKILKTS